MRVVSMSFTLGSRACLRKPEDAAANCLYGVALATGDVGLERRRAFKTHRSATVGMAKGQAFRMQA